MKKVLAIALCLVVVLGLFAGCNQHKEDVKNGIRYDEQGRQIITIGIPQKTTVQDYNTNAYTLWLEEVSGYNIEWVLYSSSAGDYKTQLATALINQSEPLPDILVIKPKEDEAEEPISLWTPHAEVIEEVPAEAPAEEKEANHKKRSKNRSRGKKSSHSKAPAEQPKKESADAPQQSKNSEGNSSQQKKKPNHHHKHTSKPKAPQANRSEQAGEAKGSSGKPNEQKKAPQSKTPAPQAGGEKNAASAPKKKNNYHRYRGKPKSKPAGGSAPKSE